MTVQSPHPLDILFTPMQIGAVSIRNRIVMPAMQRGFNDKSTPTDRQIEYLRRRGEGGAGLIISEAVSPDHPSGYWQDVMSHFTLDRLGQWERLVHTVRATGARFFIQLWHPGAIREVKADSPYARFDTVSPSGLIQENRVNGRAATRQELDDIKGAYVRAAADAKRIGADGIEIHAQSGYFLHQFLWHETNLRDDDYGGATLAERARYPSEIVRAVRAEVGPGYPISFRFSQWAEVDYGARTIPTPEDLAAMVRIMEDAGANCFHASCRRYYKPEWPDRDPYLTLAAWTKTFTSLPVINVGSVGLDTDGLEDLFENRSPKLVMERDLPDVARRISGSEFDFIGIGRAQIANPDFAAKVKRGQIDQLILFDKTKHLNEFMDEWDIGAVEEFRKVADDA